MASNSACASASQGISRSISRAQRLQLTITTALGFDTYVVMRHGVARELGCYFCNDVVAPSDSQRDRTLDQMCTVSRPGLSMVASALAVELMVSVLHHSHREQAPADVGQTFETPRTTALGIVPHQIRGFLSHFSSIAMHGSHYPKCTACSSIVVDAYKQEGFGFVKRVCGDSSHLEEITGLKALAEQEVEWEAADDDDF